MNRRLIGDDMNVEVKTLLDLPKSECARKIDFIPSDQIIPVGSSGDYSKSEKESCWYSRSELEKLRQQKEKTALRLDSGKKCKRGSSYRGLECCTRKGEREMEKEVYGCIDAVLDEQEVQWRSGVDDIERIADLSRKVSKRSATRALRLAKLDEKEARKEYRRMQRRSSIGIVSTELEDDDCASVSSNNPSGDGTELGSVSSISTEYAECPISPSANENVVVKEKRRSSKNSRTKRQGRSKLWLDDDQSPPVSCNKSVPKEVYSCDGGSHNTLWV